MCLQILTSHAVPSSSAPVSCSFAAAAVLWVLWMALGSGAIHKMKKEVTKAGKKVSMICSDRIAGMSMTQIAFQQIELELVRVN